MRRSRTRKPAARAISVILLITAVTAGASASAESYHGVTTRCVIALLLIVGGLEAIELLQAVILPLLSRIERKIRRIRKGLDAIRKALGRIGDALS